MDTLIRFGFSIEDIKSMMDTNHSIEEVSDNDIMDLITLLKENNCSNEQIENFLLCNPFFLSKNSKKMKQLIQKLKVVKYF